MVDLTKNGGACMGWQQIVVIIYFSILLIGGLILDGEKRTGEYKFSSVFFEVLALAALLYTGGFWD